MFFNDSPFELSLLSLSSRHAYIAANIEKVYSVEKSFTRLFHLSLRLFIKSAPTFQPPTYSGPLVGVKVTIT